ncbi:MAG: 50S ribosomal protein L4 [Gemmatimonadaceae bacterium]
MNAASYDSAGGARDAFALPGDLFDGTINMPVMHQAVKAYLANQRQGNASTKTRGFVIGGNAKPWKQKGTGRARQGSIRAPQWVGGGTVFGPTPRSYAQSVPRKVRALARKSAFNARARENAVIVIDAFDYKSPKTSQLLGLLNTLGVGDRKVLILTDGVNPNVYMSGRNLPRTHVLPYSDVSTYHLLWSDVVIVESGAFGAGVTDTETTETTEEAQGERADKAEIAVKAEPARKKSAKRTRAAKKVTKSATKTTTAAKKTARTAKKATRTARKATRKAVAKTVGRKTAAKKTAAKKKPATKRVAKKTTKRVAKKKGR